MLTALIADDEQLARHLIREYLLAHADIEIVAECEKWVAGCGGNRPSQLQILIFLDIQMPKLTGLEVLEASGRRSGVIFTTAYDEYALKAFDLHAIDYLLKPFAQTRFDEALTKARAQLGQESDSMMQLVAKTRLQRIFLIRERRPGACDSDRQRGICGGTG